MISDYQKFQIPDSGGKHHLVAEVNWDAEDQTSNACQIIRLTLPDGTKTYVKRADLNQILFSIGDAESQRRLVPQTLETVHWRETVLGIKATKDIKKGEMINFPIKISFPCTNTQEVIGERAWRRDVAREQRKDLWTPTGFTPLTTNP